MPQAERTRPPMVRRRLEGLREIYSISCIRCCSASLEAHVRGDLKGQQARGQARRCRVSRGAVPSGTERHTPDWRTASHPSRMPLPRSYPRLLLLVLDANSDGILSRLSAKSLCSPWRVPGAAGCRKGERPGSRSLPPPQNPVPKSGERSLVPRAAIRCESPSPLRRPMRGHSTGIQCFLRPAGLWRPQQRKLVNGSKTPGLLFLKESRLRGHGRY
nr:hypothetical protein HJG63_010877 [Rousettus aegyptiacus]